MILRYLYVGSSDIDRDIALWSVVPNATMRWRFQHFGADVAAIDLGSPPVLLLADHRPPGSVLPIYAVDDLETAVAALVTKGWTVHERSFGTPEGLAALVGTDGGSAIALLKVDRPTAMEDAYADSGNPRAVRTDS
ncbi:MAG: hypothetical protein QOE09_3204 [Ilumatobacteraceae bacterium]